MKADEVDGSSLANISILMGPLLVVRVTLAVVGGSSDILAMGFGGYEEWWFYFFSSLFLINGVKIIHFISLTPSGNPVLCSSMAGL